MIGKDHGVTWTVGSPGYAGGNECQAVMLDDNSIMLNVRNDHERYRAVVISRGSWTSIGKLHATSRNTLIEPNCNGRLLPE